jgi:hypothetical protein
MSQEPYPRWRYFPAWRQAASWVSELISAVDATRADIESSIAHLTSNQVLEAIAPRLRTIGFEVEGVRERVARPVLFGDQGGVLKSFNVDGFRAADGIVLEVESGGAMYNNRVLFDVFKMCLAVDAQFGVVLVPQRYVTSRREWHEPYPEAIKLFEAIYANPERFHLPLEGLLLVGY